MVLHRFQTILRAGYIVGNNESVLSTWCLLLKVDVLFPYTRLNQNRHVPLQTRRATAERLDPSEVVVLACDQILSHIPSQDELRISPLSTEMVPRSLRWSSGQTSRHSPFDSIRGLDGRPVETGTLIGANLTMWQRRSVFPAAPCSLIPPRAVLYLPPHQAARA